MTGRVITHILDTARALKTPYEALHNKSPSLANLKVFGCLCYATSVVKEDKFSPRASASVFLGYAETRKGYRLMDLSANCFFVCRDVYPLNGSDLQPERVGDSIPEESTEPISYDAHTTVDTKESEEVVEEDADVEQVLPVAVEDSNVDMSETGVADSIPYDADMFAPTQQQSTLLNDTILPSVVGLKNNGVSKSKRASKEPLWLQEYVTTKKGHGSSYPLSNYLSYVRLTDKCRSFMTNISTLTEPKTFTKASKDKRWIEVMEMEIKALEDNKTWSIVDLPKGKRSI
ncbi:uncharacterized protein LOC142178034 [Nicotiana tabacum]|uniref:Uncharacterized protein LOC142178034 n=1 Tax=Nicotiana tabacum TaxID=4097 RepID=A0AC58U1U6_TOBAC